MRYKVKRIDYPDIHYFSECTSCDWDVAIGTISKKEVLARSKEHVRVTGHSVNIVQGSEIILNPCTS